jgi:NADPH-dependent 7-cyano-7-deazaguanine reductase QueF-like protein
MNKFNGLFTINARLMCESKPYKLYCNCVGQLDYKSRLEEQATIKIPENNSFN